MGMGDQAAAEGDETALIMTSSLSSDDDESTESSDTNNNREDTISVTSLKTNGSVLSVVSNASSSSIIKTGAKKKRVQFLPDGFLVRVREIPPRSNKSSSDSDGSASDSSDGSDGSDSDSAGSDSEDVSSERDTPSPAAPTESQNKFATMPPLMYMAKGSYAVSKHKNGPKSVNAAVAKITGIDPATVPLSSSHPIRKSSFSKKARRSPSPKFEKRTRRNSKTNVENVNNNSNNNHNNKKVNSTTASKNDNSTTRGNKKRTPLKIKEGLISPPPSFTKQQKQNSLKSQNNTVKLSQRRVQSASDARTISPTKRISKPTISTSVSILPTSSTPPPLSSSMDSPSVDRVSRAMQSLTMGKLYTVDGGFIFPPHHTKDLHLPDLPQNAQVSKSEDFEMPITVSSSHIFSTSPHGRRPSTDLGLGSPRRSYQESNATPHQTQPLSANRKRRYYAWQMANGSIHNALHSTPSISQLWDSPGKGQSETTDKFGSNSR